MGEKYYQDLVYLKEKVEEARKKEVNVRGLKSLSHYFQFIVTDTLEFDKCYVNFNHEPVIALNKDYSYAEKLVHFTILLGYSLIYLKDNPNANGKYYEKNTRIPLEYDLMFKHFTNDLLLGKNMLGKDLEKKEEGKKHV